MSHTNQPNAGTSPRNTTLNILNGNSFLNLDYQTHDNRNHSLNNNFISRFMVGPKMQTAYEYSSLGTNTNVKSAQYSRKNDNIIVLQKIGYNPKTEMRIREEKGHRKRQSSIEYRKKMKITDIMENLHNTLQCKSERDNINNEKQRIFRGITINPQSLQEHKYLKDNKNIERRVNSFSENYKNKRKLMDRLTHRKLNELSITLRWDSKPKDIIKSEFKSKYWSPYAGKLSNRKKDSLPESMQGNKIQFFPPDSKSNKIPKLQIIQP